MDWQALRDLGAQGYAPKSLLDVGAHLGGFSKSFVEVFPGCVPVLIEPNPHCAAALSKLPFEWHAVAASHEAGEAELHLTTEWLQTTGASLYRENTHFFRDEVLTRVRVPKLPLDAMFPNRRFDFVKIDTQGAELDVLRGARSLIACADFVLAEISLVDYNAGGAKAEEVFAEFAALGFACAGVLEFHRLRGVANGGLLQMDFLFENRARRMRSYPVVQDAGPDSMMALVAELNAAGRDGLAASLMERLAGLHAPAPEAIEAMIGIEFQHGAIGTVLELLVRLREMDGGRETRAALIRRALTPAAERIAAHMAAGEWDQAERYAVPLAKLVPGYAPAQRAAMTICAALAKPAEAGKFARLLLNLDPDDAEAVKIARCAEAVADAGPAEIDAVRRALFQPPAQHPLLTLRDIHDAAAAIMCGDMGGGGVRRLGALLAEARGLNVDVPGASEFAGWVKHYRLAVAAMNPSALIAPFVLDPAIAPDRIVTIAGETLSPQDFSRRISDQDPQAVFFAAADVKYAGLYADHFAGSIARNCDVRHTVVLHVIGGAARLEEIARTLGVRGGNVFLTGDNFDAASVATKCFDTPPKGLILHPAAHYQSARFQRLGWLLRAVNAPVFVSDIDLLLQRGVSDLLARVAGCDVVLNENANNWNAGSRLTANLVLVKPSPAGLYFAHALKSYLDAALNGPEVSRWIDQFALLMARHRLRFDAPDANAGYFDTDSDINNVMYRTYEKNPFRFLSLYHGFDMTSLERAA